MGTLKSVRVQPNMILKSKDLVNMLLLGRIDLESSVMTKLNLVSRVAVRDVIKALLLKNLFGDREGDGSRRISNVNHINCIPFSLFSG